MAQDAAGIAAMLPIWAIVVLIWWAGVSMTTIAALVWRAIGVRSVDQAITGAKQAVLEVVDANERRYGQLRLTSDGRIDVLERELFGLDGENGVRGNVKVTRREVGLMMIVLRRLAESAGIDAKELDVLIGET